MTAPLKPADSSPPAAVTNPDGSLTYTGVTTSITTSTGATLTYPNVKTTISAYIPPASITTPAVALAGGKVVVTVANGPGNTTDWVGIAVAGSANNKYLSYVYLNGKQTPPTAGLTNAVVTLAAPTVGTLFEVRFFLKDSFTLITSTTFQTAAVLPPPPPPAPPPPVPPPPVISPDGSTLVAPDTGFLTTVPGKWTFGAGSVGKDYLILLNGIQASSGKAVKLLVANAGKMYANTVLNAWYIWNGISWIPSSNPIPTPIITVNPIAPSIADTIAKGAVVATYKVTMSDGSLFTGTIAFAAPNFDSGGIYALSGTGAGGNIIVSLTGPGVGSHPTPVTESITLQATQS